MTKVACIVEGDGEVAALPVLLRRIATWRTPGQALQVAPPIRVRRDRFLNKPDEFARHLALAAAKCGSGGWILVLLDADDDCPARLGPEVATRALGCVPHRRIGVVLANREYEAWFIAAAQSLQGQRGFHCDGKEIPDAETPRDAKGWMRRHMGGRGYGEATDQAAFTACMDLAAAHAASRSFRKLCSEWDRNTPTA